METHLVVSETGVRVVEHECRIDFDELKSLASVWHDNDNLGASIASGSFKTDGMIIVPCSMKTVAAIAHGYSEGLLTRAADVCIKEHRRLVIIPRETPLSTIHLENMLKLSQLGVRVMPASPEFYSHPETIGDMVTSIVGRGLDQLGIEHNLLKRWGE